MKIIKIALLLLLTSTISYAENNDLQLKTAQKLIGLFELEKYYDQAFDQVLQLETSFIQSELSTEDEALSQEMMAAFNEGAQQSIDVIRKKFTWQQMEAMFAEIYADTFTIEEMQAQIDFYGSEMGRRLIAKQPELTAATMQKMQEFMMQIMPEIEKELAPLKEEILHSSEAEEA